MKTKILFLFFLMTAVVLSVNAQELAQNSNSLIIGAYRSYKDVDDFFIQVPTAVEIPFANEFIERLDFAVLDVTTNSFEPYFFIKETTSNKIPVSVKTNPVVYNTGSMIDDKMNTNTDFLLPEDTQGRIQIILTSVKPITSSVLTTLLADNVALPSTIEIRALVGGQNRIIVANKKMDQPTIRFPQTVSGQWTITFSFGQPLRISELRLLQENMVTTRKRAIRFLAQPEHTYRIYFNPDRSVIASVGEAGNLLGLEDKEIILLFSGSSQNNPNYIIADVDKDGVADSHDNCVSISNPEQQDINNNGRGDKCDDFDHDGLINSRDNCPNQPNRNQLDTDSDGIGDVCDTEESRITEQHKWIPWVGISFAALVLIIFFILTAKSIRKPEQTIDQ
ncbi:thrombospondin type 3 repeat-containing protein [Patescibacteria group bacterium]|nr:thrombospondin type 3 repeat-containing protein [Patescibacteria group bacterium]MBU1730302.1 thrombospondin type 3 repeat-containing protein [Patescibacteria group bacterium]MBU1956230.1 thrombospondin type 3 repeat-containing protein [Patescibacteria group bacterium]MBU2010040.1 thrombospondin type 3 repeat-containing protein [Patescibacteria group bacterium]